MRKEEFSVGSYVHVYNRGHRKGLIARDSSDFWRYLKILRHFNDIYHSPNWLDDLKNQPNPFNRPSNWPSLQPLVKIVAYCLMPNHFHLILQEIREGGITKFMQKMGTGMSNYFNAKYHEQGSIFQGSYRLKTIKSDEQLRNMCVYVMVKNPMELYPEGLEKGLREFEVAYEWISQSPFNSLGEYRNKNTLEILSSGCLDKFFQTADDFKSYAFDWIPRIEV